MEIEGNYVYQEPQKIKIHTSYYAMYKKIPPIYQCVAISNSKPKSMFIPVMKYLAPCWSLVQSYKKKQISKTLFEDMYMQQLYQTITPEKLRNDLLNFHNSDIVFLCYEKELTECHRLVLLKYIYRWLPEFEICGELNLSGYIIPIGDKPWEK